MVTARAAHDTLAPLHRLLCNGAGIAHEVPEHWMPLNQFIAFVAARAGLHPHPYARQKPGGSQLLEAGHFVVAEDHPHFVEDYRRHIQVAPAADGSNAWLPNMPMHIATGSLTLQAINFERQQGRKPAHGHSEKGVCRATE